MTEKDSTKSYAFVSYAHTDGIIAEAIDVQLRQLARRGRGRDALDSFLDTRSIKPGERWEPVITDHLHIADWLIVVFTGDQSDYCGFEIGMFSQINGLLGPAPAADKRLVCLHDVETARLPVVVKPYQATRMITLNEGIDQRSVSAGEENDFWWESPIGKFLREFCHYKALYVPDPDNPTEFKADINRGVTEDYGGF